MKIADPPFSVEIGLIAGDPEGKWNLVGMWCPPLPVRWSHDGIFSTLEAERYFACTWEMTPKVLSCGKLLWVAVRKCGTDTIFGYEGPWATRYSGSGIPQLRVGDRIIYRW